MAKKRHRRRNRSHRRRYARVNRRRHNPMLFGRRHNRHHRRRRHNPLLAVPVSELIPLTGWAVLGMAGARILPQMVAPSYNTSWTGYAMNAVTAVGLSWLGGKFAGTRAAQGLIVGGFVGTAARILSDWIGASNPVGGALSGDLDFDMGFYIQNQFPLPTTGQGPFLLQPGIVGAPMQAGGVPTVVSLPAVASGVPAAGSAPGGSAPSATALSVGTQSLADQPSAWRSPWAA